MHSALDMANDGTRRCGRRSNRPWQNWDGRRMCWYTLKPPTHYRLHSFHSYLCRGLHTPIWSENNWNFTNIDKYIQESAWLASPFPSMSKSSVIVSATIWEMLSSIETVFVAPDIMTAQVSKSIPIKYYSSWMLFWKNFGATLWLWHGKFIHSTNIYIHI